MNKFLLASLFCFLSFSFPVFSNIHLADLSVTMEKTGTPPGLAADTQNADRFVSDQVKKALGNDEINVEVKGGVVTLTGTVSDEAAKVAFGEKAANVPGVKSVDNKIVVAK